jgi:phosphate-selective porin OprO/OprP
VQLGAFADNARDLNADSNNSYSLDGRVVFSPEVGGGRLHLGASAHYRDLNDSSPTVRYRARPFVHTTVLRLVDTGNITATGERNFGAELAYVHGPFHATAEGHSGLGALAGEGLQPRSRAPGQNHRESLGRHGSLFALKT